MKIVHVITRLILGGAQENTLLTCEGLHARGHDVTLITGPAIGPEGELLGRAQAGGYNVIVMPDLRREIHPVRDLLVAKTLRQLLARIKPDVMHSHSSKAGILARRAAVAVGGMKIVHTIHGLAFHPYQSTWKNVLYVALERRCAKDTDAIICVANAMARQALAAGVGSEDQFSTIYSGMETQTYSRPTEKAQHFRQSLNLPPNALLVTQVSRLAELKGHEYIIQAAANIADRNIHFCFVGNGLWREKIERLIADKGLTERFHLVGLLEPGMIPAVMQASDIVVHCSLREGLARALPQAMLAGKCVVGYDVDGASEVVNGLTGILLAPRDVPGLRAALETLAASPGLREQLGVQGQRQCMAMFDHNIMVNRIEALYQRLLAR